MKRIMQEYARGGVRRFALVAIALAGVGLAASSGQADTSFDQDNTLRGVVADAIDADRQVLAAFADTAAYRRFAGLPTIDVNPPRDDRATRAAIDRQNAFDHGSKQPGDILGAVSGRVIRDDNPLGLTRENLSRIRVGHRSKDWFCLTQALYFEARGEGLRGQIAVTEVILNRVDSPRYPDTVCEVVQQGAGRKHACQFSYYCDGKSDRMENAEMRQSLGRIAWVMLQGAERKLTRGALFYHNTSVNPRWASAFEKTALIGRHVFYRKPITLSKR